jgi:predicted RNA-binding Zn-ribbon protein involved in translation (DUF1610 family)
MEQLGKTVWIEQGGKVGGPYPRGDVLAMAREAGLAPGDRVSNDGKRWVRADKVRELAVELYRHSSVGKAFRCPACGETFRAISPPFLGKLSADPALPRYRTSSFDGLTRTRCPTCGKVSAYPMSAARMHCQILLVVAAIALFFYSPGSWIVALLVAGAALYGIARSQAMSRRRTPGSSEGAVPSGVDEGASEGEAPTTHDAFAFGVEAGGGDSAGENPSDPFAALPAERVGEGELEHEAPRGAAGSAPKRKRRMHGCLLATLIALALLVIGLPLGFYIAGRALVNYAKQTLQEAPLYSAVVKGNIDEVDRLLREGVDPNQKGTLGHPPLTAAVSGDYPLIAERLLNAGADPDRRDNLGWAPLHHAVKTRGANLDMIVILVRHGAGVDVTDKHLRTPLHRASQFGHVQAVRLLVRLGADPGARDENGWTPLDRGRAHPGIVEILRDELNGQ